MPFIPTAASCGVLRLKIKQIAADTRLLGLAPSALDHAVPFFFLLPLRPIGLGYEVGISLERPI